jgi:hypothetical protein
LFDLLSNRYSHLKLPEKSVISKTLNSWNFSYISFYLGTFLYLLFIKHSFKYLMSLRYMTHFACATYTPKVDTVLTQFSKPFLLLPDMFKWQQK